MGNGEMKNDNKLKVDRPQFEAGITKFHRITDVMLVLISISGFLFYILFSSKKDYWPSRDMNLFIMQIFVVVAFSIVMILSFRYVRYGYILRLNTAVRGKTDGQIMTEANKFILDELQEIQKKIEIIENDDLKLRYNDEEISQEQYQILMNRLSEHVVSLLTDEFVANLRAKLTKRIYAINGIGQLESVYNEMKYRLKNVSQDLHRNGTVNMFIGIIIGMAGLILFFYYLISIKDDLLPFFSSNLVNTDSNSSPETQFNYTEAFLLGFLPRLSFIILIEAFALFFLKLYKSSLGEIKYFENEITNIECKFSALFSSLISHDSNARSQVVCDLSGTERNFIIEKGQSTVELEQNRINQESFDNAIKALSEALKSVKSDK